MKEPVWKLIAQMFRFLHRRAKFGTGLVGAFAANANVTVADKSAASHGVDASGTFEFRFRFDPDDTTLLPVGGKRIQCPCCDDEFTAYPDGAVACSRCVGTMQCKHLRDRQLYPTHSR